MLAGAAKTWVSASCAHTQALTAGSREGGRPSVSVGVLAEGQCFLPWCFLACPLPSLELVEASASSEPSSEPSSESEDAESDDSSASSEPDLPQSECAASETALPCSRPVVLLSRATPETYSPWFARSVGHGVAETGAVGVASGSAESDASG